MGKLRKRCALVIDILERIRIVGTKKIIHGEVFFE